MVNGENHNVEWDDAVSLAYAAAPQLQTETLDLSAAIGRALAADVVAEHDLPPAHTAMMDGYAVAGPGPWKIVGELHAGSFLPYLEGGSALKVSTGAHIPPHSLFVIPEELATLFEGEVASKKAFNAGQHIRPPGDEASAGELIAPAGTLITPAIAGLAASSGHDRVEVTLQPAVSVIVTGNELVSRGEIGPGQIRDSLTIQVTPWAKYLGAVVESSVNCDDDQAKLVSVISESTANVIITTGGTAHGEYDFLRGALAELNATYVIDEIHMRPGHPTILAKLPSGQFVAGLPGNPLAALVSFLTVVAPVLKKLSGQNLNDLTKAELGQAMPCDRTRIIPVSLESGRAVPTEFRGSAMLRGLGNAHALAVIDPGDNPTGTKVRLLPLPWRVS